MACAQGALKIPFRGRSGTMIEPIEMDLDNLVTQLLDGEAIAMQDEVEFIVQPLPARVELAESDLIVAIALHDVGEDLVVALLRLIIGLILEAALSPDHWIA